MDASKCFRQMVTELVEDENADEQSKWVFGEWSCIRCTQHDHCTLDFRRRCMEKLESSEDTAVSDEQHGGAVPYCPTSLVLNPVTLQNLLIKRSKAYTAKGLWVEALNDANKVRCSVSHKLVLTNRWSPGDRTRSTVSMGLPQEACCITQCWRLSKCNQCIRGDALKDVGVV